MGSDRGALPALQLVGFWWPALRTGQATSAAPGSLCVHTNTGSALVCITRTRHPASWKVGSQRVGIFASHLRDQHFGYEHTRCLRHVTGFPGPGLLQVLRPFHRHQPTTGLTCRPTGTGGTVPTFGSQPINSVVFSAGRAQPGGRLGDASLMPARIRVTLPSTRAVCDGPYWLVRKR